jgi:hypothetical protein
VAGRLEPYEVSLSQRYAAVSGSNAQVWELPESGHLTGILDLPREYEARMIQFFDTYLGDH